MSTPDGVLEQDEAIRPSTTPERLAELPSSFAGLGAKGFDAVALRHYPDADPIQHSHTAGNSSAIVDGAAAVLVGGELTGPAPAARRALDKAGLDWSDIDLVEVNEAFAAVVLRFLAETGLSPQIVNVNGGAIALGHPLGATGAMLLGTVLDELERRDLRHGLITLCVGAGTGVATIVERLD